MIKIIILIICLIAVPSIACDPGDAPGSSAPSAAAPSAAAPSAAAPSATGSNSGSSSIGGMADGGAGVDQADFLPTVEPDCWIITNGYCVNIISPGVWSVKGHPRGEIWYKVHK